MFDRQTWQCSIITDWGKIVMVSPTSCPHRVVVAKIKLLDIPLDWGGGEKWSQMTRA